MADIYFDNNATTQVLPTVLARMLEAYETGPLNPSSNHRLGALARRMLREAREHVAQLVGATPEQLVFTSGATEANHRVLELLRSGSLRGYSLLTTPVEHSSVLEAASDLQRAGVSVRMVPIRSDGQVTSDAIERMIDGPRTLVSIQWANNETGVIQPIRDISAVVRAAGALLHVDAVQAAGKTHVSFTDVPIDFLVLSSHKINGPQGVGSLVARDLALLKPPLSGGGQERSLRPGTENLPGIVGFGEAARLRHMILDEWIAVVSMLRDDFESELRETGVVKAINGEGSPRICNTSNVCFKAVDGEALLLRLQARGLVCSQGSACTSHRPEPSHVLRAMGLGPEAAWSSLRFSLSAANAREEVRSAVDMIRLAHEQLTQLSLPRAV